MTMSSWTITITTLCFGLPLQGLSGAAAHHSSSFESDLGCEFCHHLLNICVCRSDVLLPKGNILPPSLYLAERIVHSRPPDSCAYHACPEDHKVWPHLPRREWALHKDDRCECGAARFVTQTVPGVPCLRPAKVMMVCTWLAMDGCNSDSYCCQSNKGCRRNACPCHA